MINMKNVLKIFMILLMSCVMISCSNNQEIKEHEDVNATLICPDGLPSIAISKAMNDNKKISYMNIEYSIQKTTDLLLSELMKGEAELAIVPSNLALQAYKKGLDYKIAATIGWGSLYLVSTDDITDISELKGCEIYNTGKGLTPDIVFRNILTNKGFKESDFEFSYVGAASELAPMVMSGKVKYAVLPEPALSTVMDKNKDIKIILNLNEEWAKINNLSKGYPQSTLIIKEEFYNSIKDTGLYEEIINTFNESEEWVKNNPQDAAEKCEVLGITIIKDTIDKAINNSNLNFTKIEECTLEYEKYFSVIDTENKGEGGEYDSIFIKE